VQVLGPGQVGAGDEGGGQAGLDVLLLGVVEEAGMGDGGERRQRGLGLPQRRLGLSGQGGGPLLIAVVDGPDAAAGRADDPAAGSEAQLTRLVGVAEARSDLVDEGEQFVVAVATQLSPPWSQPRRAQPWAERR
jgi:hypothetical protein